MTAPGIGPLHATAIAVLAPPAETFRTARDLAVWLGLVPRQPSTGHKQRLGARTTMGERSLRRPRIIGANSVIIKRHVHAAARPGIWLGSMLTHKPPMLVRVALANKMVWIVWALMARSDDYGWHWPFTTRQSGASRIRCWADGSLWDHRRPSFPAADNFLWLDR